MIFIKTKSMKTNEYYRSRAVMLVDHCQFCNFVNKKMLISSGFASQVTSHSNAMEALALLMSASASGTVPEFIFVNLNMRKMNGAEFSVRVEAIFRGSLNPPKLVLLSSSLTHAQVISFTGNKHFFAHLSRPLIQHDIDHLAVLTA